MNRLAVLILAGLTGAWIIGSLFLLHGWTVSSVFRTMAVVVDVPLAVWLAGVGWTAYRRAQARRS